MILENTYMYKYHQNKESYHITFIIFLKSIIWGGGVKIKDVKICLDKSRN
jgi:hypothetical protein